MLIVNGILFERKIPVTPALDSVLANSQIVARQKLQDPVEHCLVFDFNVTPAGSQKVKQSSLIDPAHNCRMLENRFDFRREQKYAALREVVKRFDPESVSAAKKLLRLVVP